jgi:hypothetical protein
MTAITSAEALTVELRAQLVRSRRTPSDVASLLNLGKSQVSARLNGRMSWKIDELFAVAELCGIPLSRMVAAAEAEVAVERQVPA